MRSVTLVDGTDLTSWANRRDAQELLPRLLRRVIHATVPRALRVGFPAGDAIQLGGWDGIVLVEEGTPFVPRGTSAWELGVNRDVKGKADKDYETRRANPRGVDPATSSFVFFTPRRWKGKADWIAGRQREGRWREVLAYDADDLEAWLELAPAVHIWISILAGKHPEHATDLGTAWEDWAGVTRPRTTAELVLAGRDEVVERVRRWLDGGSDPLAIQAEARDEALAVFAAVVHQLPLEDRVKHLSRALVVRDLAAWHQLAASEAPLILVPAFDSRDGLSRAERGGHRIVIPLGRGDAVSGNTVIVPRLSSDAATDALVAAGMSEERSRDLAFLARRSLASFRRKLAVSPEVQQPEWAHPSTGGSLLPVILAGGWNDAVEADRLALGALAQAPYDELARALVQWSNVSDAPVRRVGDAWMVVSGEDAWGLLGRYVTKDHLGRLETVALDVLAAPDPQFDLPDEGRWMAGVLGPGPRHSKLLREGLADMLAVMGCRGRSMIAGAGVSVADYAGRIVRRVLEHANADWRVWASLSPVLPRLAEAAPDAFLAAVDDGLGGEMPLSRVFGHDGDPLFNSSPHTGLLWALETVAWSPEHLSQAAVLLAKLARVDPGGRLQNRPQNSLRSIFLLWHPQTAAGLEHRLRALDLLMEREPEVGWRLLRQLLPEYQGVGHNNPRPRLRDWAPDSQLSVAPGEYVNAVAQVVNRMLPAAGVSGSRWRDLIEGMPKLHQVQREAVVERLAGIDAGGLEPQDRAAIWEALRRLIARHRSFPNAEWALPREYLDRLDALNGRFLPGDPTARYAWLFSDHPDLPEERARDWKTQQDALDKARLEAVRAISGMRGLVGLMELARQVARPDELGATLGRSDLLMTEEDELLSTHLASADAAHARVAHGFAAARSWTRGREWAERKLETVGREWSAPQRAEFLACLAFDGQTWALAEAAGADTEKTYWRLVRPFRADDDLEMAVSKLLEHGRPYTAIHLLSMADTGGEATPTPALILNTLERAIRTAPEDDAPSAHFGYDLGELLDLLEQADGVDDGQVAAIEWAFLPEFDRHERKPRVLHRELARNPRFFAELVALAFRAEGEEPRELSDQERMRAHHAHDLLDSWRVVPGSHAEGVDAAALKEWVRVAREAVAASGRGTIGDEQIGQVLSGAPPGEGGAWPHSAVCDVVDTVASADLEQGLEVGVYNSRGTVTKHPFEGGRQERQLAERYAGFAVTLSDRWPRTAAMLRRLADGYRLEAQREDQRAELREDRSR